MKLTIVTIETANGRRKSIQADCTPMEWLTIRKSLRLLLEDEEIHPDDKAVAKRLLYTEPEE